MRLINRVGYTLPASKLGCNLDCFDLVETRSRGMDSGPLFTMSGKRYDDRWSCERWSYVYFVDRGGSVGGG